MVKYKIVIVLICCLIASTAFAENVIIQASTYLVNSNTAGIAEANQQCPANGCMIMLPCGTYTTTQPIPLLNNVEYRGCGAGIAGAQTGGTRIINNSTNVFVPANNSSFEGTRVTDLYIAAGAGHIFDFSSTNLVDRIELDHLALNQGDAGKAVLNYQPSNPNADFIENSIYDITVWYADNNTVAPFNIVAGYIIQTNFSNILINSGSGNTAAGTWVFELHGTIPSGSGDNNFDNITMEQPGGGGIEILGLNRTSFKHVYSADLTITPLNPEFYIGSGNWITFTECGNSTSGGTSTQSVPSLSLNNANFLTLRDTSFQWVVGANISGGAGQVTLLGSSSILNRSGINTVSIGGGVNGLEFQPDTTDPSDNLFTIWKGMRGYWDGSLYLDVNGNHALSVGGNGTVNFGKSNGVTVYYCSSTGILARGNGGSCPGGSWQATNISVH